MPKHEGPGRVVALEFYSGIGGLHLALKRSNIDASVVRAFDWDQTACQVYEANHGPNIVNKADISTLTASSLASLQAGLWLLSPACQPYTVINPHAKGATDPRAKSFLHLFQNILPDLVTANVHPTHLLVENVAGFESSTTRQFLISTLRSLGYITSEFLLTPLQFGIPNSRLRYYLLAKATPLLFRTPDVNVDLNEVWRHIPGPGRVTRDWVDPRLQQRDEGVSPHSVDEVRFYLDETLVQNETVPHPYAVPERILQRWGRLFDIVLPSSRRTCCFTRGYTRLVERSGSILQMNEELDTTETFDDFLQAQARHDKNAVGILHSLRLRYFSPAELLRLFDFDSPHRHVPGVNETHSTFVWPEGVTTKAKFRLVGNSVNVRVVKELINFLFE